MRHSATNHRATTDVVPTSTAVTTSHDGSTGPTGQHSADRPTAVVIELTGGQDLDRGLDHAADAGADDHMMVHVQLRPRRASARKCLAALAQLATQHAGVPVCLAGLSKDDRVLRITVAVDLGPRLEVARFSPAAQAAYAFVSDLFTVLYDHMPVYATEPTPEESAVVAPFLRAGDQATWGSAPVWQSEVLGAVTA